MGWDGSYYAGSVKDWIKNGEFERRFGIQKVLEKSVKGGVIYSAIQHEKGYIFGLVSLVRKDKSGYVMVKDMDESMHPYCYDCPEKILKMLSPTKNENEVAWRDNCHKQKDRLKVESDRRKELDKLPIGTRIDWNGQTLEANKNVWGNTKREGETVYINKDNKWIKKSNIVKFGWSIVFDPRKMKTVFCLDDFKNYYFGATSGYDALTKMLYTLNLSRQDDAANIVKMNKCWGFTHSGKTYAALID